MKEPVITLTLEEYEELRKEHECLEKEHAELQRKYEASLQEYSRQVEENLGLYSRHCRSEMEIG